VVIIDQAPDDSFEDLSLSERAGRWPLIGPALNRLTRIAPDSVIRSQYDRAFAPGFSVSAGFENPDQVVDDLREMTYTAFDQASDAEGDYTDEEPLDERLAGARTPLLVIFGSEDQTYDADEALVRYEAISGVQTELIDGAGHSPNVEKPEEVAPLILAFAAPPPAKQAAPKKRAAAKQKL
ncbi:MAG TPA: alpha/beta fold hydrolase, partial [Solirubrobacterales bacterium]|nr:alpha/beta fold hydrolase [Solirubrobacterales bacterium]